MVKIDKEFSKMTWCWNSCSTWRGGISWIKTISTRVSGSLFFVVALILICLFVPSFKMQTYVHSSLTSLLKSNLTSNIRQSIHVPDKTFHNIRAGKRASKVNRDLTERGRRKFKMLGRKDMLATNRKCSHRMPNAIVIGVMKAGTEAFSTFLTINPQVAMSLNVPSTLFFSSRFSKGFKWYKQQMTCSTSNQTTIEKAPQYFPNSLAPKRIHSMNKNIKLILLVRNPIDRAVSHFLQMKNSHPERLRGKKFEDVVFTRSGAVNPYSVFIRFSKYSNILRNWLRYFKLSQILILDSDQFVKKPLQALAKTESFLGIKHYITKDKFVFDKQKGFPCLNVSGIPKCLGSGKGREHPKLRNIDYNKLKAHFRRYNEDFFRMTKKRYTW